MNLQKTDTAIRVTLSRRNLEHLLRLLDNGAGMTLNRMTPEGLLIIEPEENDAHYKGRTPGPGADPRD